MSAIMHEQIATSENFYLVEDECWEDFHNGCHIPESDYWYMDFVEMEQFASQKAQEEAEAMLIPSGEMVPESENDIWDFICHPIEGSSEIDYDIQQEAFAVEALIIKRAMRREHFFSSKRSRNRNLNTSERKNPDMVEWLQESAKHRDHCQGGDEDLSRLDFTDGYTYDDEYYYESRSVQSFESSGLDFLELLEYLLENCITEEGLEQDRMIEVHKEADILSIMGIVELDKPLYIPIYSQPERSDQGCECCDDMESFMITGATLNQLKGYADTGRPSKTGLGGSTEKPGYAYHI